MYYENMDQMNYFGSSYAFPKALFSHSYLVINLLSVSKQSPLSLLVSVFIAIPFLPVYIFIFR